MSQVQSSQPLAAEEQVLQEAVARNAAVVVSLPSAGMLRHQKSRFLGPDASGIWVEYSPAEAALVDSLIQGGQPVGVSFKSGVHKVVFTTPILARQNEYKLSSTVTVAALLLQAPAQIKMTQRRASYRVTVPSDAGVSARIWRISGRAFLYDKPLSTAEVHVKLMDISTGGIGVMLLSRNGEPAKISPEDRLRIDIISERGTLTLEGRLRHRPVSATDADRPVRAGIQFERLQDDIEGRRAMALLTRIIGELHRRECQLNRMGIKIA